MAYSRRGTAKQSWENNKIENLRLMQRCSHDPDKDSACQQERNDGRNYTVNIVIQLPI